MLECITVHHLPCHTLPIQGHTAERQVCHNVLLLLLLCCPLCRTLQPVEIIELSCVIVDTKAAQITSSFQVIRASHSMACRFCVMTDGMQMHASMQAMPCSGWLAGWLVGWILTGCTGNVSRSNSKKQLKQG